MDWPLFGRMPLKAEATNDEILNRFLDYVAFKKLELYPAQEEAILALIQGKNVILNTPTGSGKSLVAMALHFQSLAQGRRSYYTCPIKALVNEKFRDLCANFGPDQVGMITGDGSVNAQAPIICCTAEILSNLALREGPLAPVDDVVMDEFHYYSDKERGVAWQVPLLALPQTRFLLMSATLGEMDFFAQSLSTLNTKETQVVTSLERPVPLDFLYKETSLHESVADLIGQGLSPIYLVNFSQRDAAEQAQNLLSLNYSSKEEKARIQEILNDVKFQSPYGKEIQKLLKHGIGIHHAGLLPKYRVLVERLAQAGLLKVISGTDTLGVGVNVPIRTVLFTKLCKYDGEKTAILSVRDFHQIAGRAGRKGFDNQGTVVAQAPEHVIENLRVKSKAAGDPKKLRKIVLKNPPPRGFVMWTKETFTKLQLAKPEVLQSRFKVDHAMLLNVLSRDGGPRAMQRLIRNSHGTAGNKKHLRKVAFELLRSLLERKIVLVALNQGHRQVHVNTDLQIDFSLNQTLSLYLLDTLKLVDPASESYALNVLTLVESILESPEMVLRKQTDVLKTIKMNEMKSAGIEYDERIAELEKIEHPKPSRDFIYETFNTFRSAHPWVGQENIRPKSISREMFENFYSFADYIREYDLQRIEGTLLRYLSEVYKVLEQTVPDAAKDDELREISIYFGVMVRTVDSSLLDEWEKMRPGLLKADAESAIKNDKALRKVVDPKLVVLLTRNLVHTLMRALSKLDFETAISMFQPSENLTPTILEEQMKLYQADHPDLRTDSSARGSKNIQITIGEKFAQVEQTLIDSNDLNDWILSLKIDLACLVSGDEPALIFEKLEEVGH